MRFSVLGSGSKGNSVYIESDGTGLLIDNGFSGKELERRLTSIGRNLDKISAICLTHEHNDHVSGAGIISRRCKIPVHANVGTFRGAEKKTGKLHRRVEFNTGDTVAIGNLEVQSFAVSHDTADPVGFVISDGKQYLGYCTDTGMVTRLMKLRLSGCHGLIIEFNHDPEMLRNGPYPLMLQQRVRSNQGHLANSEGAGLVAEILHSRLRYCVLAHLSETNNSPALALAAAAPCFSHHHGSEMILARQDQPTQLLTLEVE